MGAHETRTFRSGKGVALRLPESLAVAPGERILIGQDGDLITLRRLGERGEAARRLRAMLGVLEAIGGPGARVAEFSESDSSPG
jgi:virulence-associated protein VagC